MNTIYYMGFYSDPDDIMRRKTAPAADDKMNYIIRVMKEAGYNVEILSFCVNDDRTAFFSIKPGYKKEINNTKTIFFTNYASKYTFLRIIGRICAWRRTKNYIKKNCLGKDSIIVIYHSLGLLRLVKFLNKYRKKFVLEMEEVYADVIGKTKLRKKEIRIAKTANAFMFPTQLLSETVNVEKKPEVIIHGTYQVEKDRNIRLFDKEHIHCVYAGTFDPRKGGCTAAVAAAEFLPENYHMHIIGFGSKNEVENIQKIITETAKRSKAKVSFDGLKSGEEYIQYIQSCDIGLSTQNPDAAFNATSFPSKVLSYLANGLHVVSIRIPAIEKSAVGDMLSYYDKQTPEEIARAIMSVDLSDDYDGKKIIAQLDKEFKSELRKLLEE